MRDESFGEYHSALQVWCDWSMVTHTCAHTHIVPPHEQNEARKVKLLSACLHHHHHQPDVNI